MGFSENLDIPLVLCQNSRDSHAFPNTESNVLWAFYRVQRGSNELIRGGDNVFLKFTTWIYQLKFTKMKIKYSFLIKKWEPLDKGVQINVGIISPTILKQ